MVCLSQGVLPGVAGVFKQKENHQDDVFASIPAGQVVVASDSKCFETGMLIMHQCTHMRDLMIEKLVLLAMLNVFSPMLESLQTDPIGYEFRLNETRLLMNS